MLLGESPGAITALVTVAAAAFYGAASLGARVAYEPLGVEPREIGLTAATVLAQSAIGVLAVIVLALLLYVLATRTASAVRRRRHRSAATGRAAALAAPRAPGLILVAVYLVAVALTCIVLLVASVAARQNIEQGIRPGSVLGLPAIWPAEVATLRWATSGPAGEIQDRPSCVLYIGEANGTRVLYDAPHRRTLRIQSSDVAVEATRSKDRC